MKAVIKRIKFRTRMWKQVLNRKKLLYLLIKEEEAVIEVVVDKEEVDDGRGREGGQSWTRGRNVYG
jgi:hypothetical protein